VAEGIPARLTPGEGRKFGLTVGGAFLALAGLLWWRGRVVGALVCAVLGGVLVLAGLIVPARLGTVHRAWMGFGRLMSRVTTPLFMGIVYFLILTPTGWVMRLLGKNPVARPPVEGSFWVRRPEGKHGRMDHQF
jgi:saxitoxin biosynthesis operon SxtJ-like protein